MVIEITTNEKIAPGKKDGYQDCRTTGPTCCGRGAGLGLWQMLGVWRKFVMSGYGPPSHFLTPSTSCRAGRCTKHLPEKQNIKARE
jgi:hypothetical protein